MTEYVVYGIVTPEITVKAGELKVNGPIREAFNIASQIFIYPEGICIRRK